MKVEYRVLDLAKDEKGNIYDVYTTEQDARTAMKETFNQFNNNEKYRVMKDHKTVRVWDATKHEWPLVYLSYEVSVTA